MALVHRNGRPYVYRSVRRDGRVTSKYEACGKSAALIDAIDEYKKSLRDCERADIQADREELEAAEKPLVEYFDLVEQIARAALLASGCHQHKRQWRKRRARRQES
jgi:hypothetical protein